MMKGPVIYYPIAEMFGTDLSGTKKAKELRLSILEDLESDLKVELDFKGVRSLTPGWVRNSLGVIVTEKGEDFFRDNIRIINHEKVRKCILEGIGDWIDFVESK